MILVSSLGESSMQNNIPSSRKGNETWFLTFSVSMLTENVRNQVSFPFLLLGMLFCMLLSPKEDTKIIRLLVISEFLWFPFA